MAYSFGPENQGLGTAIGTNMTSPPLSSDNTPASEDKQAPESSYIKKFRYFMIAFLAVYLAYLLFLLTRSDVVVNSWLRGIGDTFVYTGSAAGTIACFLVALRTRQQQVFNPGVNNSRAWLAWLFLSIAGGIYTIGQIIYTWYDFHYISSQLPFPASYDFCYLSVYPLSWIGISMLVPRAGSFVGRTRLILDSTIVVLSILTITWFFILGPTITGLSGNALAKGVALAYPLGDLSLCIIAAILLFGPSSANSLNSALSRMAIGVAILAVTDSIYGYFLLKGVYHTGFLEDWGWPASWLFIGLAALYYRADLRRSAHQRVLVAQADMTHSNAIGSVVRATVPLVLTVVTSLLILVDSIIHKTTSLIQIVIVITVLFILPVIRQVLTLKDNQSLNKRMQTALDQSQQAFQQSQQELLSSSSRVEEYEELRAGIENVQSALSQLARGDLNARAAVQGPLAPVAQSINLLIDRMSHWVLMSQRNTVLEQEATSLHNAIDTLSEGRAQLDIQLTHQGTATQGALLAIQRLQKRLTFHFRRLRAMIEIAAGHQRALQEIMQRAQQTLQSPQEANKALLLQEDLNQMEQRLRAGNEVLQDIYQQSNIYTDQNDNSQPDRINTHSTQQ
jgi:hypothetical protein